MYLYTPSPSIPFLLSSSSFYFQLDLLRRSPLVSSAREEIDIIFNVVARPGMSSEWGRRGLARGWWLGCFAARNTLHYTVGVVYKRLFFFSLACLQPPPPAIPFFSRVYLSFSPPSFSSGGHVDVPASLWEEGSRGRRGGGGVTSRKAQPDSSRFFFLSFLFLVSPIYFFPSSSFSHTPSLPPCAATVVLCFAPPSFLFLRNYRKLVPWRGRFVIRLILSRDGARGGRR